MPVLNQTDLQSLNTQQIQCLQQFTDRAAAAVDTGAARPVLNRTDLQFFDTEQEEALRSILIFILTGTNYLGWAAYKAAAGFALEQAFDTTQTRDLLNAFGKYCAYLDSVD